MFKNLKTSTQISIKFTLFTILQVTLLSILINVIFFHGWYNTEVNKLQWEDKRGPQREYNKELKDDIRPMPIPDFFSPHRESFAITSDEWKSLLEYEWIGSISKIDDMYFIYHIKDNKIIVSDVTPHVNMQENLILISLYLIVLLSVISYLLSLFFVKSSLRKLNDLNSFLDKINIDNLDTKIEVVWPSDDEINKVSHKFNEALDKIYNQTLSLKDFIKNASHELKTPLMSISTEIDYSKKSGKYDEWLVNIKKQISTMNWLLDSLLSITKAESMNSVSKSDINISDFTKEIIDNIKIIYKEKKIKLQHNIEKNVFISANAESLNIIIKNVLDNAFKFTPEKWVIEINLTKNKLVIKDSWIWISQEAQKYIWDRFWQADESNSDTKSFGLWLYLTKMLVEKHWWKIDIESELNVGTSFIITFN